MSWSRKSFLLFISVLLVASTMWAAVTVITDVGIEAGEWTEFGERDTEAAAKTLSSILSGDGNTRVQFITEDYGNNGLGSITFYRRGLAGWEQQGEGIPGTESQPIAFGSDVSYDGTRIAYRALNRFREEILQAGELTPAPGLLLGATDTAAPDGSCQADNGTACPGITWGSATDVSSESSSANLHVAINGDEAYSFYAVTEAPTDLSLARLLTVRLRVVSPADLADPQGSTPVTVSIACPSGCDGSVQVSVPNDGAWVDATVSLQTVTDEQARGITQPFIITLEEKNTGLVLELERVEYFGAGDLINVVDYSDGRASPVLSYASRVQNLNPVLGRLSPDGEVLAVTSLCRFGPVPNVCYGELAGVAEVFTIDQGVLIPRGEPIIGLPFALQIGADIDASGSTLALGSYNLGFGVEYEEFKVFSFNGASWTEDFSLQRESIGWTFPYLSDDGSVLIVSDGNYSYPGFAGSYGESTGTYAEAAPNAGRIRRFEKVDSEWTEVGVPLIGRPNDRLAVVSFKGVNADGSVIVSRTLGGQVDRSARSSLPFGGATQDRTLELFGQSVTLPESAPVTLPPASRSSQGRSSVDSSSTSEFRALGYREGEWHQIGGSIPIGPASELLFVNGSISSDGLLMSVAQNWNCERDITSAQCPDGAEAGDQTYTFTTLTDRLALESLYSATAGEDWDRDTGWLRDSEHCSWYGVLCDGDGFVSALWLDNNNLAGNIPDQIGNLRYLRSLDLSENYLSGTLPATIAQLQDLSQLFLASAGFSGPLDSRIGDLSGLQYLELGGNQLSGMTSDLGKLGQLRLLDISNNSFIGGFPGDGAWPLIEHLNMSSNALSGELPTDLSSLSQIRFLNLGGNGLSGRLPQSLQELQTLKTIDLSNNQFSGPISEPLGAFLSVREPALTGNAFNCPYPSALEQYFTEAEEACVPPSAPSPPVITSADPGDGEITLVVSVPSDGGANVVTYDAFCSDGSSSFAGSSKTNRIVVSGLTNGESYTCSVTATNSAGFASDSSALTSPIVPEELLPGPPIWLLYEATKSHKSLLMTVFRDAQIGPKWTGGLRGFDEGIDYNECTEPSVCPNLDWEIVSDEERNDVLEIRHTGAAFAGFYIHAFDPGLDMHDFYDGHVNFDVKVVDAGASAKFTMKIDCIYPCGSAEQDIGSKGRNGWETVQVKVADLVSSGLQLGTVTTGLTIWPSRPQGGVVYRLDNIYWSE